MKFSLTSTLVVALAAQATANSWFGKSVYDRWHESELERWLSDNNIPHPSPSDRKNLQKTVADNWNDKIVNPYQSWDAKSLQNYLTARGQEAKKGTENDAKSLAEQVKAYWYETEDSANQAYGNVKDWIFDSWTDSQLKAFADKHGIPVPQPRQRDSLLKSVRENYQSVADKASETANYPGDWLYASWSDSDLKAWFDERGYNVPQPSTRDSLIASLRRQSRLAGQSAQGIYAQASSSAAAAQQSLSDALLDSWSDSQIKEWADKNGIKVPQGSKRNELLALARKHRARLYGDSASATAASAYGAATSNANSAAAQATDGFAYYTNLVKQQFGIATDAAAASASSASKVAAASASSATGQVKSATGSAAKAASSSSSSISKSAASASAEASKSAQSAASAASKSAQSGYNAAGASASSASAKASKASSAAKDEL
ncbi:Meiotic sister chromatid recombination protein 1 [Stagonosporopsis vannaccii]|nr:Meiotic sister chromatid recombination protein 1 [Stagonosporopsis vannaccii]